MCSSSNETDVSQSTKFKGKHDCSLLSSGRPLTAQYVHHFVFKELKDPACLVQT